MRDADYIWSEGRVIRIDHKNGTHVTIRYDGWGESYDERALWTSDRLAPLFTFTKCVKCLVNILPKVKGNPRKSELDALPSTARKAYSNLWPCKVQFRMPHPVVEGLDDEDNCLYAEEFLRAEANVFIQPYCSHLLPPHVRDSNDLDGGRWLAAKRLRLWTDDPLKLGVLPKNFNEAFEIATNDTGIVGVLPAMAIEKGTLLKAIFRVHSRAGVSLRDGALLEAPDVPERLREEPLEPIMEPPVVVQTRQVDKPLPDKLDKDLPLTNVPPPSLPPPIEITDPIYHGCGVRRCKTTSQWTASMCLGGNEIFLGLFPTQTQAYQATRVAAGEDIQIETDLRKAQLADLLAVPIEAIIDAKEKQYVPAIHDFSIHEYSLQQIRHEAYLTQLEAQQRAEKGDSDRQASSVSVIAPPPRKNKRKGTPRKVDLGKKCFVEEHG